MTQGDWRILFEEAEISDLNCRFDMVLGIRLGDAIVEPVPSGMRISDYEYLHAW